MSTPSRRYAAVVDEPANPHLLANLLDLRESFTVDGATEVRGTRG